MTNPKFKLNQIWRDSRLTVHQKIIAITDNATLPIVTQDKEGDVWSYTAEGRFPDKNSPQYDLVTLVCDVNDSAEIDA